MTVVAVTSKREPLTSLSLRPSLVRRVHSTPAALPALILTFFLGGAAGLAAALILAQRAFWAALMRAMPTVLIVPFCLGTVAGAGGAAGARRMLASSFCRVSSCQQALGSNSKAVHQAYAKHAEVNVSSLDEWEKQWEKGPHGIAQPKLLPVDFRAQQGAVLAFDADAPLAAGAQSN